MRKRGKHPAYKHMPDTPSEVVEAALAQETIKPVATLNEQPSPLTTGNARKLLSWLMLSLSFAACAYLINYARVEDLMHQGAHRQAEAYFSLLYGSGLPVVILDSDGKITEWNEAATQMFGWTRDEVLGKEPKFMCAADEYWELHCKALMKAGDYSILKRLHVIDCVAMTKSGEKIHVNLIARAVRNGHGPFYVALFTRPENLKFSVAPDAAGGVVKPVCPFAAPEPQQEDKEKAEPTPTPKVDAPTPAEPPVAIPVKPASTRYYTGGSRRRR